MTEGLSIEDWLAARTEARSLSVGRADRLGGLLPGLYRSFFKGRGLEYDESRRYQPGDDHTHIDWRVTARTGQLHTKAFREERERTVLFALDVSDGMRFGTRRCQKWVRGAELMALIAWLAVDNDDRVGGLVYGLADGIEELGPGVGESAAMRLYRILDRAAERPAAERPDLSRALRCLRRHAVHGALIVILSDFRRASTEDTYDMTDLARDKDVCLVHVHDPLERHLPDGVPLTFWSERGTWTVAEDDIVARHMSLATEELPLPALLEWSRHKVRGPTEVAG